MKIKPKYRTLSDEELVGLEKELIQFLVVNGIDGERWKEINKNNPQRAQELIILFSDSVFSKILEKTPYFFYSSPQLLHFVKIESNFLKGIWIKATSSVVDSRVILKNFNSLFENGKNDFEVFQGTKKINKSADAVVELLDRDYKIDLNGYYFKKFNSLTKK